MTLRATVAIALPDRQHVVELALPDGSRVADALAAPAVRALLEAHGIAPDAVGIWSRRCPPETPLQEGDRVEVYRPLAADPKSMRRERARLKPSTRSRSGR
ncbi:MAG TPA: RnfH family protein [Usitatibacter sp.]|nr:RnfH family protein [Usitatibacter sp.]